MLSYYQGSEGLYQVYDLVFLQEICGCHFLLCNVLQQGSASLQNLLTLQARKIFHHQQVLTPIRTGSSLGKVLKCAHKQYMTADAECTDVSNGDVYVEVKGNRRDGRFLFGNSLAEFLTESDEKDVVLPSPGSLSCSL